MLCWGSLSMVGFFWSRVGAVSPGLGLFDLECLASSGVSRRRALLILIIIEDRRIRADAYVAIVFVQRRRSSSGVVVGCVWILMMRRNNSRNLSTMLELVSMDLILQSTVESLVHRTPIFIH